MSRDASSHFIRKFRRLWGGDHVISPSVSSFNDGWLDLRNKLDFLKEALFDCHSGLTPGTDLTGALTFSARMDDEVELLKFK